VKRQVAPFSPQAAQLALEGSPQVLDLVAFVDGQQVAAHLRILRLRAALAAAPTELGRFGTAGERGEVMHIFATVFHPYPDFLSRVLVVVEDVDAVETTGICGVVAASNKRPPAAAAGDVKW